MRCSADCKRISDSGHCLSAECRVSLMSCSHRAALRFLRGGLIAVVAVLLPSQFGFVSGGAPAFGPVVAALRVAVPALGFAIGGAVGGTALGRGRMGVAASSAGFLLTGIAMSLGASPLTGLTGFENPVTVLVFAATTSGAAFALGGCVMALLLDRRTLRGIVSGFLAGGAAGGVVSVMPAVLATPLAALPSDFRLFFHLACSLLGLVGPFAVAGAVAGAAAEGCES
jgi:hypothetical protein